MCMPLVFTVTNANLTIYLVGARTELIPLIIEAIKELRIQKEYAVSKLEEKLNEYKIKLEKLKKILNPEST